MPSKITVPIPAPTFTVELLIDAVVTSTGPAGLIKLAAAAAARCPTGDLPRFKKAVEKACATETGLV
jgi:hypothetical protein